MKTIRVNSLFSHVLRCHFLSCPSLSSSAPAAFISVRLSTDTGSHTVLDHHHLGARGRVPAARSSCNITDFNTAKALWHSVMPFSGNPSLPLVSHTDTDMPGAVKPSLIARAQLSDTLALVGSNEQQDNSGINPCLKQCVLFMKIWGGKGLEHS